MLETIAIILIVLWLLGVVSGLDLRDPVAAGKIAREGIDSFLAEPFRLRPALCLGGAGGLAHALTERGRP